MRNWSLVLGSNRGSIANGVNLQGRTTAVSDKSFVVDGFDSFFPMLAGGS